MVLSFRPALLCAATLLAPLAASAGEITLFEDAGFRGRPVTLRSDTGDLSRMGFNDKTSSIIVRSGTWEVCKDAITVATAVLSDLAATAACRA